MRHLFWILFCAFVCFLLAEKSGSIIGSIGTAKVASYGGLVGLGLAVATSRQLEWGLGLRLLTGILWTLGLTGLYYWVFRPVSYQTDHEVLFWGGLFGFLAPAICFLRGIFGAWKAPHRPK
jgi:hypothetical protein